ncbi:MAG: protein phosphatase 2C domain-containing protein [Candidatus Competibacteraceae bacterium]|nr:protein phosphatase 2C domain-containing protein [Candidatus Competibacteraceae bacterium]
MNSDVAIYTGKTHAVCQDYARASNNLAIISDGCSGSPDSDFGARILVKTAEREIQSATLANRDFVNAEFFRSLAYSAKSNAKNLGLSSQCVDATLGYVVAPINNYQCVRAQLFGDGYIAVGMKDQFNEIRVYRVEYESSYPFYLNYVTNHDLMDRWLSGSDLKAKGQVKMFSFFYDEFQSIGTLEVTDATQFNEIETWVVEEKIEKVKWVAVMSDGVDAFVKKQVTDTSKKFEPVSDIDVLRQMLNFKNFKGEFVKRRMNRFMDDNAARGWVNNDDVSIGVVYLGA